MLHETTPQSLQPACTGPLRAEMVRSLRRQALSKWFLLLPILSVFAVLAVGLAIVERRVLSTLPTGWHHAVLTGWAVLMAGTAGAAVIYYTRRHERQLSNTAEHLTRVLESYQANPSGRYRFHNPNLMHCRDVRDCDRPDCPMFHPTGDRCWQVMSLRRASEDHLSPTIEIQRCLQCDVFRISCPDKLTELGESFNNLMFLLEEGTEQVDRLRAQMVEKDKMSAVGQIAAGVAHEIGNPLSSISSIVQMLKRSRSSAATGEQLDLIETHIQRISSIVRQLVTMARPTSEQWERVDVGRILDEAVRLVAFDRRAQKVEIDFGRPETLPATYALPGGLQQVFLNLALNALDAMPDGGRLTVRADADGGRITVAFGDTGCGIAPEAGRRVFEPFFTTKQPGQGAGLGLAVSYGIVQKHGGDIDFESRVGQGTLFTVRIPVRDREPGLQHVADHDTAGR